MADLHTFSGLDIDLTNLRIMDISITDIAHGLALCNRFAGQSSKPISVAQHSVWCSFLCDEEYALQALLHDASEAYIGDVTKWFKQTNGMEAYRILEHKIQNLIFQRFGCSVELHPSVGHADQIMVRAEALKGFDPPFVITHPSIPQLTPKEMARLSEWCHWDWARAERRFLERFLELT